MPIKKLKILCVHGLGDHRNSTWEQDWPVAIHAGMPEGHGVEIEYHFLKYDSIFEGTDIDAWEAAQALWKLTKSGVGSIFRKRRGAVDNISKKIRWTAGYVVAWLEDETFQERTRRLVLETISDFQPDIIIAHSLGSLITYNAFTHRDAEAPETQNILENVKYLTIGSQLANPFVVGNLTPGRLESVPTQSWHHFYNEHDDVFTAQIKIFGDPNFQQVETPFDTPGPGDHSAEMYLSHINAKEEFWRPITEEVRNPKSFGPAMRLMAPTLGNRHKHIDRPADRRALLIGINEYPNAEDRLEGCVNDVFLMSSVLQEMGFIADEIRVCLDHRATAEGILKRLEWLLDDPQPGDERVFYFSGHGTRIPQYGEDMEPDHFVETLVPWDFAWSPETSITDEQIANLYSQLPYDMRFSMILDCCHAGGLNKSGGATIKGLTPPDDIRHRELMWDKKTRMWVERTFSRINKDYTNRSKDNADYFGRNGATVKLGRASWYRGMSYNDYKRERHQRGDGPIGPYLPLILQACSEEQYAYEYRHGATSYGAFTYSLADLLRRQESDISFAELMDATLEQLQDLGYDQEPEYHGPDIVVNSVIPWS